MRDVKIIPSSTAKSINIRAGMFTKAIMKYFRVTNTPIVEHRIARAKKLITLPKNVGSRLVLTELLIGLLLFSNMFIWLKESVLKYSVNFKNF